MPATPRNVAAESRLQISNRAVFSHRVRLVAADLVTTPGIALLNPVDVGGYGYRIIDVRAVANGGAAAGITALVVAGYQGGSLVNLASIAVAALTQSTLVKLGDANVTILANGASFATCDKGTGLRVMRTGSALTTATSIDVIVTYCVEKV